MPASGGRTPSDVLHVAADTLIATVAGALVVVVFYPITLGAAGVKGLVRLFRPHPVSQGETPITSTK